MGYSYGIFIWDRKCVWIVFCGRSVNTCQKITHTATHCNTLQHTATHCNTLQHTTPATTTQHPCHSWAAPQVVYKAALLARTRHVGLPVPPPFLLLTPIHPPIPPEGRAVALPVCVCVRGLCFAVCCSVLQCVAVCWQLRRLRVCA